MAVFAHARPALFAKVLAVVGIAYLFFLHGVPSEVSSGLSSVSETLWVSDPCTTWDPAGVPEADPPDCLRARQYREFQAWYSSGSHEHLEQATRQAIHEAERCALGVMRCPDRPIVLIDYKFWYKASWDDQGPGETVWGWAVTDAIRAAGFVPVFVDGEYEKGWYKSWSILRALQSSIQMYLPDANAGVRCLLDPRCVRAEDLVQHENATFRLAPVHGEEGTLPAWRMFGVSFWGSRPQMYASGGQYPCRDWGQCDNSEWSFHPLGNKWIITPFPYPNDHTYLPMSIEQACRALPAVPHDQREDAVLVLAKLAYYFNLPEVEATRNALENITEAIKPTELWTTAFPDAIEPIPDALVQLGPQSRADYRDLLGRSKVMLGIGKPELSPSPYEALCRGVPVVLPYATQPEPEGWAMYKHPDFQHEPIMTLGEPYAYSYKLDDPESLLDKLLLALDTPIESYIPEDMTTEAVYERVHEFLHHDWEAEYETALGRTRGSMPKYPDKMIEKCFNGPAVAPCEGKWPTP